MRKKSANRWVHFKRMDQSMFSEVETALLDIMNHVAGGVVVSM
jgi:hypothetical protein